jgi:cold shock CspA family protein
MLAVVAFFELGGFVMATGQVKWFRKRMRIGFIKRDGERDVFFHERDLIGHSELEAGDVVEFDLVENPRGPCARNVRRIAIAPVNPHQPY